MTASVTCDEYTLTRTMTGGTEGVPVAAATQMATWRSGGRRPCSDYLQADTHRLRARHQPTPTPASTDSSSARQSHSYPERADRSVAFLQHAGATHVGGRGGAGHAELQVAVGEEAQNRPAHPHGGGGGGEGADSFMTVSITPASCINAPQCTARRRARLT